MRLLLAALLFCAVPALAENPLDYGAIPNDGLDDGPAFRIALDLACDPDVGDHYLEVPVGVFDIEQEPGQLGGLNIAKCNGLSIIGKGRAASRLRMIPRQNTPTGLDYYLINITQKSQDIEIAMLTLDGRRRYWTGTAEQIHLIRIYEAKRVDLHDMDLVDSLGAGIKNITVQDISVVNVRMRGHGRGGFEGHSLVKDVRIVGSSFTNIRDQHISQEGGGGHERWTLVANNHGKHGDGTMLTHDLGSGNVGLAMVGNTLESGGVQSYNMENLAVVGNIFHQKEVNGPTALYLKGKNQHAAVVGNIFDSVGTGDEAYCLRVALLDETRNPHTLTIGSNVCKHGGGAGYHLTSAEGRLVLDANIATALGGRSQAGFVVSGGLTGVDQRAVNISDNLALNETTGVRIGFACTDCSQDDITISGNTVVSDVPDSLGLYHEIWSHYDIPWAQRCRGDGNIFDVMGPKWHSTGTTSVPPPDEGCLQHGPVP